MYDKLTLSLPGQLVRLVGSTLLHYATNGSVPVQGAALIELCEIAAVSDKHAYVESLRTVTGVARTATGGDDISYQTVSSGYPLPMNDQLSPT